MLDLQAIFAKGTVPTTAAVAQPVTVPEPIPRPEVTELATPAADPLAAEWEKVTDFDSLPLPGRPCPQCGSLEMWWDILGSEHCQQCERETLDKSFRLEELAAQLRKQAQPRKPAPRIASGCVAGGMDESKHVGGNVA
jgi:hypothetical protein